MIIDPNRAKADRLRDLAFEMTMLADQVEQPSRSTQRADVLIDQGERIAAATRAVFRGRGRP